jgi:hypothetical protein
MLAICGGEPFQRAAFPSGKEELKRREVPLRNVYGVNLHNLHTLQGGGDGR